MARRDRQRRGRRGHAGGPRLVCDAGPIARATASASSARRHRRRRRRPLPRRSIGLLDQLVTDDHEIVTIIEGEGAAEAATTADIEGWLEEHHARRAGRDPPRRPAALPVPPRRRVTGRRATTGRRSRCASSTPSRRRRAAGRRRQEACRRWRRWRRHRARPSRPTRAATRPHERGAIADLVSATRRSCWSACARCSKRPTRNRRTIVNAEVGDGTGHLRVVVLQPAVAREAAAGGH